MRIELIKLTKIKELPDAVVPNNIEEGYMKILYLPEDFIIEPKVGEALYFHNYRTSVVTEILSKNSFKTLNSIYEWEAIES